MANHETWYFCHDQPLKCCQLYPGDRGVIQILPSSVTVSLPTSGMHNPACDCKSCENSLSFLRGSSLRKDVTSFHCSLKAKWILLFLPVKKTWKSHLWKLWNWDTNINNVKCVRCLHITLGFGGLMPVFHQQYYDTLSPMQNCLKVITPLFTYTTIYLLHTGVVRTTANVSTVFWLCKVLYILNIIRICMTMQTRCIPDLNQNEAHENPTL